MPSKYPMERLRPLRGKVILKREDKEESTAGGIIIPETARVRNIRATVAALGDPEIIKGKEVIPEFYDQHGNIHQLKVGLTVMASTSAGWMQEMGPEKEEYYWLKQKDVQMVIVDE